MTPPSDRGVPGVVATPMIQPIADNLVLVFTFGMSLKAWRDTGMLEREWALYQRVIEHYRRLILVTYGDATDVEILKGLTRGVAPERVRLIHNPERLGAAAHAARASALVAKAVDPGASTVVKTNQMVGGELAVEIVEALRRAGGKAALIARGGYLWSRFVTHEHGPHSDTALYAAERERTLCQSADMVVGTTQDMVDDLAWRYGLNPSHTRVVPNYVLVDSPPVSAEERERGLVLYAGQLVARKRVHVLIDAAAALAPRGGPPVTFEIIGEGPERASLEERAHRLGAPVVFHPRLPHRELLERMSRCTIYAQASTLEGHPKTVLEAMGTGAPVIVADAPGLAQVVAHGSTGLRVAGEADSFAAAIGELLGDQDWRELLGTAASRAVRGRFGLPVVVEQEVAAHRRAVEFAAERAGQAHAA